MRRTYEVAGRTDKRAMREFLKREGQLLLPMVELVERAELAIDEVIGVMGRATIEAVLEMSAEGVAGPKQAGKARGAAETVWYGRQSGQVYLSDRKVRVDRPRLRQRRGGDGAEVEVPAYRAMAAATGLPEYMFTGDASNSNFASTMTAEGPAVREFESWQDFFEPVYLGIYRWVMKAGAEAGQIKGLEPEDVDGMEIEIAYPPLLARDELKHTRANQIRHDAKVLSREGWAGDDGIDWAVEKPRIEAEREGEDDRDFDALARMAGRGDPDDEEDG